MIATSTPERRMIQNVGRHHFRQSHFRSSLLSNIWRVSSGSSSFTFSTRADFGLRATTTSVVITAQLPKNTQALAPLCASTNSQKFEVTLKVSIVVSSVFKRSQLNQALHFVGIPFSISLLISRRGSVIRGPWRFPIHHHLFGFLFRFGSAELVQHGIAWRAMGEANSAASAVKLRLWLSKIPQ